jgi:hypothetical protein
LWWEPTAIIQIFWGERIFQQKWNWWREVVISMDGPFVVTSYYDNIKCFVATA